MKYSVDGLRFRDIYIPSFIKISSAFKSLGADRDTRTHRQEGDLINLLLYYFFKIKKVG
jgi:hypothetical protein